MKLKKLLIALTVSDATVGSACAAGDHTNQRWQG